MPALTIRFENAGKRFLKNWLFRNLNLELNSGDRFAITGLNGSGKSTLLQIISGFASLTEGKVGFMMDGIPLENTQWYKYLAVAAPYLDLHDELSLQENISFFTDHKAMRNSISAEELSEKAGLGQYKDRSLKFFSSGMKQRVRLALALSADVPFVLLDEPTANLDANGIRWFHTLMEELPSSAIVLICSNHIAEETSLCSRQLDLSAAKM